MQHFFTLPEPDFTRLAACGRYKRGMTSAQLAFDLALSIGARRVVQVGSHAPTSRALIRAVHSVTRGRGGLVVAADLDAARLRQTTRVVGERLGHYLLLRAGDARCTMQEFDGPFDLVWLACPRDVSEDVTRVLAGKLADNALVMHMHPRTSARKIRSRWAA